MAIKNYTTSIGPHQSIGEIQGCLAAHGARIVWIKTPAGKSMPCNPRMITFWERPGASGKVVLQNGKVISCDFEGSRGELTGFGYTSHFSTCPQARGFRRNK